MSAATETELWDAIIVGGGPAGLSAALMLGRCRRKVLLFDDGRPRNASSRAAHGFFTRDGEAPAALLQRGREQLASYDVRIVEERVTDAGAQHEHFEVATARRRVRARKLLLATGIVDRMPAIEGIDALCGRSVFHCPLCDGWEVRDRRLAVYGHSSAAVEMALALTVWSDDLLLCTDGWTGLSERERDELAAHDIVVRGQPVIALEGEDGALRTIVFAGGERVPRDALFLSTGCEQRSDLVARLGCDINPNGLVQTGDCEEAGANGVYVVGDASEDVSSIAIAVAEGVKAACAVNRALRQDDSRARMARFRRRRTIQPSP
jgi:thioredoxin reductase